ncbi:CGGC domain-containing protein [Maridesulfovibrio bastinii]|uniref:CGGC domain-containing protein n=1 Tax=Maridesulfovibrio bastinii TaxID=47157 RepID=UPI0004137B20|nr:CGGC domain-containing protein [Maridesulfovibrio bastinii]
MSEEKVLVIGCTHTMDTACIGCSRCMVGFNRKAGEFERYDDSDELTAILGCGGCPGSSIVQRMALIKLWNGPMGEVPTKVHIAPCIAMHCPHKDTLIEKIQAKAGVEVIIGTHPFQPKDIFAV